MGPNLIDLEFFQEEEIRTQRHTGGGPCEDTGRRRPPTRQGQPHQNLGLRLPVSRMGNNKCSLLKPPPHRWYSVKALPGGKYTICTSSCPLSTVLVDKDQTQHTLPGLLCPCCVPGPCTCQPRVASVLLRERNCSRALTPSPRMAPSTTASTPTALPSPNPCHLGALMLSPCFLHGELVASVRGQPFRGRGDGSLIQRWTHLLTNQRPESKPQHERCLFAGVFGITIQEAHTQKHALERQRRLEFLERKEGICFE